MANELIHPVSTLFRFNSGMLSLGLSDLTQQQAVHRLKAGEGSSIAYLTGHITSSRYGLLKVLGAETDNPYQELYGAGVGSKDASAYPPIAELKAGWDEAAEKLHVALDAVTEADALAPDESGFPIPDQTLRGRVTFVLWHETYHIGHIGLLRTEQGLTSMRQLLVNAR